jgi:hypothetical protein
LIVKEYVIPYRYGETVDFGFLGDIHYDAINCKRTKVKQDIQYLVEKQIKVFGMGDYWEAMTPDDFRYNTENFQPQYRHINPDRAVSLMIREMKNLLNPLGDNLLGLLTGNHENTLKQRHKIDMQWQLCNALQEQDEDEIKERHPLDLGYNCACRMKFVQVDESGNRQKTNVMTFKLWHGAACPATRETRMTKLIKHSKHFLSDLHVVGHWHDLHFDDRLDHLYLQNRGALKLRTTRRYYGMSGSYYLGHMEGVDGYVDQKDYSPAELGMLMIRVNPETREMERIKKEK